MLNTGAVLLARLIFAGTFLMASLMKFAGMESTAAAIESIGFPFPLLCAWLAAFLELGLVLAFVTGVLFVEAAALAAAYVLFLGFAFYGPASWQGDMMRVGIFINHLTFFAGLLFAIAHGPGRVLAFHWRAPWSRSTCPARET